MQDDIRQWFEQEFLSIPDVDETLLKEDIGNPNSTYVDQDVELMWYWFKKGIEQNK